MRQRTMRWTIAALALLLSGCPDPEPDGTVVPLDALLSASDTTDASGEVAATPFAGTCSDSIRPAGCPCEADGHCHDGEYHGSLHT